MLRRQFIASAAAAFPAVAAGRVWAAPQAKTRLLVVFLRGAYDAANVVIPVGADFYYQSRPTIAVPKPDPANPNAAITLDADWGLHPALKGSIYPLWQQKQIAFVPFAGTDDLTRSHFETQDTIELGQPLQGPRDYGSGFMSRLASQLSGAQPIAFTDQLPPDLQGRLGGAEHERQRLRQAGCRRPPGQADREDVPGPTPGHIGQRGLSGSRRGLSLRLRRDGRR